LRKALGDDETPIVLRLPIPNKLIGFEEHEVLSLMNEDYPNPLNFNELFIRALFNQLRANRTGITEKILLECAREVLTNPEFMQMVELAEAQPASNSIH
jgi:hypothetical protein